MAMSAVLTCDQYVLNPFHSEHARDRQSVGEEEHEEVKGNVFDQ